MAKFLHTMVRITDPAKSRAFYESLGFHFEEDFTLADAFSFFLDPRHNFSGLLRHFKRRHHNAGRHSVYEFLPAECAGCFEYGFFRGDSRILERR